MFTSNSFHLYLFLEESKPHSFYDQHIHFSKDRPLASFTGRWSMEINRKTGFKTAGGHEKTEERINIDPSQTPSGKLGRRPLSLHISDPKTVD